VEAALRRVARYARRGRRRAFGRERSGVCIWRGGRRFFDGICDGRCRARHDIREIRSKTQHEDEDGGQRDGGDSKRCHRESLVRRRSPNHQRTVVKTTSARVSSLGAPAGAGTTSSHASAKPSRQGSMAGISEFVGVSLIRRGGANGLPAASND
jgi:hypothetical protein